MCTLCATFQPIETPECDYKGITPLVPADEIPPAVTPTSEMNEGDIPNNTSTTASVSVGGNFSSTLGVSGDQDWIRLDVTEGQVLIIDLDGSGASPLSDPLVELWNASGTQMLTSNDDGGPGLNSQMLWVAEATETLYINARAYSTQTGDYTVSVDTSTMPVLTYSEIADYLVEGYWADSSRSQRSFDVAVGGTISVDINDLTADQQQLVEWSFETWSNVTGLTFNYVDDASADIFFVRNTTTNRSASNSSTTSGQDIVQSRVTVTDGWVDFYGTEIDSYTFSTYVHEIGHALGLGHGGNYNGNASYTVVPGQGTGFNQYLNDSWQASVMSYINQTENLYVNASRAEVVSAMSADILAIQQLYGTTGNLRTGNTTYGENSNAGGYLDLLATLNSPITFTVYDEGGIDTIDLGSATQAQMIDLQDGAASDVYGSVGNMVIAGGTIIENVISGSGNDVIYGNAVDNRLVGGGGSDMINGGGGIDTAVFSGARASYTIDITSAYTTVALGGVVTTLVDISFAEFSDQTVSVSTNVAPIVAQADVQLARGAYENIGQTISFTDADGDSATSYEIWDSSGANSFWVFGSGLVDASSGYTLSAEQLDGLWVQGESTSGTQTLWVRASDGQELSAWSSFEVESLNQTPTTAVGDVSVTRGTWDNIGQSVSFSDPDGDAAATYEIWDDQGSNSFWVFGTGYVDASAGYTITAAQLDGLWVQGDSQTGTQTLWIRGSDGEAYSAWDSFELASTNQAPTASQADLSLDPLEWNNIGDSFEFNDPDGDTAVRYEIWDSVGSNSFWQLYEGYLDASSGHIVEAADLSNLWVRADDSPSTQDLWLRAYDGADWSAWSSFELETAA